MSFVPISPFIFVDQSYTTLEKFAKMMMTAMSFTRSKMIKIRDRKKILDRHLAFFKTIALFYYENGPYVISDD